ncbi:MAG: STAS domain-containing protein [Chloroflexales bacterium]|nr:STAS domain-containing protein [Chloroflexales bacterium]
MSDQDCNDADGTTHPLLALIEQLPEPCALVAPDGTICGANAAWHDVFFHTGFGEGLIDSCRTLFRWDAKTWPSVEGDLRDLLAGACDQVRFEAPTAEPPERWNVCSLAPTAQGGFIWQLTDVTRWQIAEAESTHLWQQFRDAVESTSDGFALYDAADRLVFCNRRYREIYDLSATIMVPGRTFEEIVRVGAQRGQYMHIQGREEAFVAERLANHRSAEAVEHQLSNGRWVRSVDQPTAGGGTVCIRTDTTAQRRAEDLRRQSAEQEATIRAQAALLAELSTPMLRIGAGALVIPLVGSLDSHRASRVVESLLHAVEEQRTDLVILDITGVPLVDTQVANVLIQTARAVSLLGAHTVLTGIRPDVAQTMVALGVDLGDIVTRADLQAGIRYALGASKRQPPAPQKKERGA